MVAIVPHKFFLELKQKNQILHSTYLQFNRQRSFIPLLRIQLITEQIRTVLSQVMHLCIQQTKQYTTISKVMMMISVNITNGRIMCHCNSPCKQSKQSSHSQSFINPLFLYAQVNIEHAEQNGCLSTCNPIDTGICYTRPTIKCLLNLILVHHNPYMTQGSNKITLHFKKGIGYKERIMCMYNTGVHKFSKNLGASSKF